MRRVVRVIAGLGCLAGTIAAYATYRHDVESRAAADKFASQYTIDVRRPDVAKSLDLAPSGDFASDLIADATLRDVLVPVNVKPLAPAMRQVWFDAVSRSDDQLRDAASLMLDSIHVRPGWPYHAALLGQLVFTRDARNFSSDLIAKPEQWADPMRYGALEAPSDRGLWQTLALAYIQTWPDLHARHEPIARGVFRTAFGDREFVDRAFGPARSIIGTDLALQSLPDSAQPLWSAYQQLASDGDADAAWSVHHRWESAEWRERGRDLEEIRRRVDGGDFDVAQMLCETWVRTHDPLLFDTQAGRQQLATLLVLWPAHAAREWSEDPRATLVKYFLDDRTAAMPPRTLLRAVDGMIDVPPEVRAEALARAGERTEAERIYAAAQNGSSRVWMSYHIALVRDALRRNDVTEARSFFARLRANLRGECGAQIAALDLAHMQNDNASADAIEHAIAQNRVTADASARQAPLCIGRDAAALLSIRFDDPGVAHLVDYGVDGGRQATVRIPAGQQFADLRLDASRGSHVVNWKVIAAKP